MSFSERSRKIMQNWDKEEFKKIHHPDYMFIRETELVNLDDYANNIEEWVLSGEYAKFTENRRRTALVHENPFLTEYRWEEKDEIVTHIVLKKKGLAWRSIVNRVTFDDFEEDLAQRTT